MENPKTTNPSGSLGFQNKSRAFTLIELLVVIAIISLLSSVVLASLSSARERAKIAKTVTNFQQIETAMVMWHQSTGQVMWFDDGSILDDYGNAYLTTLMQQTTLDEYLNSVPELTFGNFYRYRNGASYYGTFDCGDPVYYGVNVYMDEVSQDIAEKVNKIVDGGNETNPLGCGKIRWRSSSGGRLVYGLSNDGSL